LAEIGFTIDTVLPDASNLVISEIAYRPSDASSAAEKQITSDRDDFEFVEFLNRASAALDLAGVTVMGGIQYQFGPGTILGAGKRLILVRHRAAFEARYGNQLPVAGEYAGRLGNGGDVLRIYSAQGTLLRELAYGVASPWPDSTQGSAFSLTLVRPESNPDSNRSSSWRASVRPEGSPGTSDAVEFSGDPEADLDGNGRPDLVDYVLGGGMGVEASLETDAVRGQFLRLSVGRVLGADRARLTIESSATLAGPWVSVEAEFEELGFNSIRPGYSEFLYRSREPLNSREATFVRWSVTPVP
jgi:hypothetical protein